MTTAISTTRLTKTYANGFTAVQDLDLHVEIGQVYGFLGHNGAGKTTTIRMLLDLNAPTQGEVRLFGQPVATDRRVLRRVGALVEGATFYDFLNGRENLIALARTSGRGNLDRIATVLDMVSATAFASKKVKSYSTGMKQRLGIAAALLDNPDLIILDEPTNGLDPAGIREIRHFIRSLAHEHGKTVFLSSHLLNEVEQTCDRVAIIHHGKLLREGTIAELLSGEPVVRLRAEPLDRAADVLRERCAVTRVEDALLLNTPPDTVPEIVRLLVDRDVQVYEISPQRHTLEEMFFAATESEGDIVYV